MSAVIITILDISKLSTVIITILAIICFILLIAVMRLSIIIDFQHTSNNDSLKIKLRTLFGLFRYTIDVPIIKIDKDSPGIIVSQKQDIGNIESEPSDEPTMRKYTPGETIFSLKRMKQVVEHVAHLHAIIKKFLLHVSITKLEWHTKLGTGDAANTGIAVGVGWSVKYGVVAILSKYMRLKSVPMLSITPDFVRPISQTKLVCMIHFRIGHAMLAGLRIVKHWRGGGLSKIFVTDKANESY